MAEHDIRSNGSERDQSRGVPPRGTGHRRFTQRLVGVAGIATALAAILTVPLATTGAAEPEGGPKPVPTAAEVEPQEPFLCMTEYSDLGQPKVDNQERIGTPVYPENEAGEPDRGQDPVGWSRDCQADTVTEYRYMDTDGNRQTLPTGATEPPADIAMIDTSTLIAAEAMDLDGATQIPYLYRYERGTLPGTRFLYSIAMLVPFEEVTSGAAKPSMAHWNHRLVYSFGGGVGIGHSQGKLSGGDSQLDSALRLGDAVVYSSGTRTSVHYDLLLAGRVANELKALFVDRYDDPVYTVGIGGSGGGIQQYVNAQNNPDLLDGLIAEYTYPDMTTQTINVGDCELLEYYMDVTDGDNPRWKDWNNRKILQGQNTIEGFTSDWQEVTGATGSSECIEGWRGATPLALNPNFGLASGMDDVLLPYAGEMMAKIAAGEAPVPDDFPDLGRLLRVDDDPAQWTMWTHWDDAKEAYGVDPDTGLARVPWDNTGVQYGLRAVANGQITPQEFLDLNARIGSWKATRDNVKESCGMVTEMTDETLGAFAKAIGLCEGDELDQYSSRQMNLAEGDGIAPRSVGDVEAITNAFESGLEFDGKLGRDVPILDVRHYLEEQLDMHNVHQSFVVRQRIERAMGNADNQVIWWQDARPDVDEAATDRLLARAFEVMDEWILALADDQGATAASVKPEAAVDSCWATDGTPIASGDDVWDGAVELALTGQGAWTETAPEEIDGVAVGDCARYFPINSTSRVIAGGPITNDVYKCHLKPVANSIADGDYGDWAPDAAQTNRLEEIFPDGVCDYSKRSVGYPEGESAAGDDPTKDEDPVESSSGGSSAPLIVGGLLAVVVLAGGAVAVSRRSKES